MSLKSRLKRLEEQAAKDDQQSALGGWNWEMLEERDYPDAASFEAAQEAALAAGKRLILVMRPASRDEPDAS